MGADPQAAKSRGWALDRSLKPIEKGARRRLAALARADREDLFRRNSYLARLYGNRLLCVALCQGAALQYLDGRTGVKDFDVWTFFRAHPVRPFPSRRKVARDFGDPKFGTSPGWSDFIGRRVDLIGRSIPWKRGQPPQEAVRHYLVSCANTSPRLLARKAVVLLEPAEETRDRHLADFKEGVTMAKPMESGSAIPLEYVVLAQAFEVRCC